MPRTPVITNDHILKAIKHSPRRVYVVRDTMYLTYDGQGTISVNSYAATIATFNVRVGDVVGATINEGWRGYSLTTNRHLRGVHDFVESRGIHATVTQSRS